MSETPFDLVEHIKAGGKVRCRDEQLYEVVGPVARPIVMRLIHKLSGSEFAAEFNEDGTHFGATRESGEDLIPVMPEPKRYKRVFWTNEYADRACGSYESQDAANVVASQDRIACIPHEYEFVEGQGL